MSMNAAEASTEVAARLEAKIRASNSLGTAEVNPLPALTQYCRDLGDSVSFLIDYIKANAEFDNAKANGQTQTGTGTATGASVSVNPINILNVPVSGGIK